ncbi:MAG: ATP-dependent helicase, partial [Actinobacteria bacterium]|nr:ATP-dependent helicase [Actinomycetota bacterium]
MKERISAGLNPEQRRAVEAVRGPVCILAGAGSGKTTTITRRIAHQVASGAFDATAILAVTFTDKAAREMRERLAALGVERVQARTFHAAALRQLRYFSPEPLPGILPSKTMILKPIANALPRAYRFRPVRDLASEIEWAKNSRLTPATYLAGLRGGHEPPIPPDLMLRVFSTYERRKSGAARIDFEDVLELAIHLFDANATAVDRFRAQYRAFTVDEYQDVNLLQQELLSRWLGDRDDLCVVGDDYQSIYSFTGATPRWLLEMPERFPSGTVVRLEQNYRSTPEILAFANRLVPRLGGAEKTLRAVRASGAEPTVNTLSTREREVAFVVERVQELAAAGVPYQEMALLYRINARSDEFEEALARAGIPFQVRDGAFLTRPAARTLLRALARVRSSSAVAAAVAELAAELGLEEEPSEGASAEEATRQADLARLVRLAEEFEDGERTVGDFVADLRARFNDESEAHGVNLLTYHRAKGLEFGAVFL